MLLLELKLNFTILKSRRENDEQNVFPLMEFNCQQHNTQHSGKDALLCRDYYVWFKDLSVEVNKLSHV